ncbi:MAG TPA: hypothetical protein VEU08_03875 [Vicinamibacterales bacterium]|nr:hypothetical protein [Vicinamibacterales bacterium]
MKRALFTMLTTLVVTAPAFAQATNVTGDWDITIVSPQGPNTQRLVLKQDADKLTGMFKSQMGELAVTGSVTGSDVKIAFSIDIQGQALDITLNGKADGDKIAGTAVFGTFGEGEFTAKKATASATANTMTATVSAGGVTATSTMTAGGATATASAGGVTATSTTTAEAGTGAAGKWDVMFKTPQGDFPGTATISVDGDKLTGTFGSQMGEAPVTGSIAGKTIKLKLNAQTPQGEMTVDMSGDLDGDSIVNGKADVMGMQLDWTAKRIKQ